MYRPLSLCLLALCTTGAAPMLSNETCGLDSPIMWAGDGLKGELVFSTAQDCILPSPDDLSGCLAGRRVHIIGDSTMRMLVEYFEAAWFRCTPVKSSVSRWVKGHLYAARPNASTEGNGLCKTLLSPKGGRYVYAHHPLDRFALTHDIWKYIDEYTTLEWWTKWVVGDAYKAAMSGPEPYQTPGAALMTERIPDAVVLNSWLWHGMRSRLKRPSRDNIMAEYEAQLTKFLKAFVKQPSYEAYWGQGHTYWRMTFPTEKPESSQGIAESRAIAARVLAAVAPGIIVLDLDDSVHHVRAAVRQPAEMLVTMDGTHFAYAVQVVCMTQLLRRIAEDIWISDSPISASSEETACNATPGHAALPQKPLALMPSAVSFSPSFSQSPAALSRTSTSTPMPSELQG